MYTVLVFVLGLAAISNGRSFLKPEDYARNFQNAKRNVDDTELALQELSRLDGKIPDFPDWAPAFSVGSSFDGHKVKSAQLSIIEDQVTGTAIMREDGAYQFEAIWNAFLVGGDTNGAIYGLITEVPLALGWNVQTKEAGNPFAVGITAGDFAAGITGDRSSGLRTYEVQTDLGPFGLRFSGDAKGTKKQLDGYAYLKSDAYDYNYNYHDFLGPLGGGLLLEFRGDSLGYRGGNGTLRLGPLGARLELDNYGTKNSYAFIQTPVGLVVGSFGSNFPKLQKVSGIFTLSPFSFEILSDKPSNDQNTIVRAHLDFRNVVLHGQYHLQSKRAVFGAQYTYDGYGLALFGTTENQFKVYLLLNNHRYGIRFPHYMFDFDSLSLFEEIKLWDWNQWIYPGTID